MGLSLSLVKQKTGILVCVAYPLNTQHYEERAKTGWLGIRIMYLSEGTCLPADFCFSELAIYIYIYE